MNKKQTRYIKPFKRSEQGVTILTALVSVRETLDAAKWKRRQYIKVPRGMNVRTISQGIQESSYLIKASCTVIKDLRHMLKKEDSKVSEYQIKQMTLDLAAVYEDLP